MVDAHTVGLCYGLVPFGGPEVAHSRSFHSGVHSGESRLPKALLVWACRSWHTITVTVCGTGFTVCTKALLVWACSVSLSGSQCASDDTVCRQALGRSYGQHPARLTSVWVSHRTTRCWQGPCGCMPGINQLATACVRWLLCGTATSPPCVCFCQARQCCVHRLAPTNTCAVACFAHVFGSPGLAWSGRVLQRLKSERTCFRAADWTWPGHVWRLSI